MTAGSSEAEPTLLIGFRIFEGEDEFTITEELDFLSLGYQFDLQGFVGHVHVFGFVEVVFGFQGMVIVIPGAWVAAESGRGVLVGSITDIVGAEGIVFSKGTASFLAADKKVVGILGVARHPEAVEVADTVVWTALLHHGGVVTDA